MADLNERGQILLIAAFTLAVTFVALALVVNSAIFTENLASRGEVAGSSEALGYQHQVRQSVGEAMAFANRYNESDLTDSIKESISDISMNGGIQQARGGQLVNVSYENHRTGIRIAANSSGGGAFESQSGLFDWQLANDVETTRAFVVNITDDTALAGSKSSAFTIRANKTMTSDDIWTLWIYDDGDLVVEVETADGPASRECRFSTFGVQNFEIDVTGGTVNGQRCHALTRSGTGGTKMWFGTGIPSGSTYNITFENGDNIQGNFSFVMRGKENGTTLISGTTASDPYFTDAIYETTVDYLFVTPHVVYEAEIRVAPGEHP